MRSLKPLHYSLNIFFNDLFIKQRDTIRNFSKTIAKQNRLIKRIQDSPNTYLNDDAIINEKKTFIKNVTEQRSKLRAIQKRLLKYTFSEPELNLLLMTLNKNIVVQVLEGKVYKFPYSAGTLFLRHVIQKHLKSINWGQSIKRHLEIIKREAPIIYDKFKIQKTINKKEYFRLSKPFVYPAKPDNRWMFYLDRIDWMYLSFKPNYAMLRHYDVDYRFRFTGYSHLVDSFKTPDGTTIEALKYLDTPEKIKNCWVIGNINKSVLLQLQDPDYKLKIMPI